MTARLPPEEALRILKKRLRKLDMGECYYDKQQQIIAFHQTLNALERIEQQLKA